MARTRSTTERSSEQKHKSYAQEGTSHIPTDLRFAALAPGWRVSKSGHKYFENRTNRSDRSKSKRL